VTLLSRVNGERIFWTSIGIRLARGGAIAKYCDGFGMRSSGTPEIEPSG
jgi:hypothetical protein